MGSCRFLSLVLVWAWLAVPAAAQKLPLAELSAYLNGIKTAQADFTQINSDGSRSKGTLYIRRPGRMRFEYAPPNESLVMAGGGQVAVFDPKSNQPPELFPLARTPLNLILAEKVDLATARMVVDHSGNGEVTTVTAQDPKNPEYGSITLMFSPAPVALRQWIITDGSGAQTTVVLDELTPGGPYPPSYFNITTETEKRLSR